MATPNAEYEKVQKALTERMAGGSPFDLAAWLQTETNDAGGFLEWCLTNQTAAAPPPQTTAATALSTLKSTKFSDLGSVVVLDDALQNCEPIPLVSTAETHYFVVHDLTPVTMARNVNVAGKDDGGSSQTPKPIDPLAKITVHPSFLAPVQVTPSSTPQGSTLPKFIYPVGLVRQRDVRPPSKLTPDERSAVGDVIDKRPLEDTNYAVVVDVVTPGNPVWLIYNRNPYNPIADEPMAVDPATMPPVFPGAIGSNFDTAKAMESLAAWNIGPGATTVSSPTYGDFVALVNSTKARGEVRCSPVWMDALVKALPAAALPTPAAPPGA